MRNLSNIYNRYLLSLLLCVAIGLSLGFNDFLEFKEKQLEYPNVKTAYVNKGKILEDEFAKQNVYTLGNYIYIRVFKREKIAELWYRPLAASQYRLFKTYPLCSNSGDVGPKQTVADQKIPEGLYEINRFAPEDAYLMTLGINYPNKVDQYRGSQAANIELRGGCHSAGSMPFTDDLIEEIYILAVEAYSVGQARIPVHIFPIKMDGAQFNALSNSYADDANRVRFWNNIKTGYDYFNLTKRLPNIEIGTSGVYYFKDGAAPIVANPPILVGSLNGPNPTVTIPTNTGSSGAVADIIPTTITPKPLPSISLPKDGYHTVIEGETLYGLSKKYRHSVYTLRKWNDLTGNTITIGQSLRVAPPTTATTTLANSYKVKSGDTLYSIAKRYGLSVKALKSINNKKNDVLQPGEMLVIGNQ